MGHVVTKTSFHLNISRIEIPRRDNLDSAYSIKWNGIQLIQE